MIRAPCLRQLHTALKAHEQGIRATLRADVNACEVSLASTRFRHVVRPLAQEGAGWSHQGLAVGTLNIGGTGNGHCLSYPSFPDGPDE